MFHKFVEERIKGDNVTLFVRRAGPKSAPPLVLLHGYPQTSAMWHRVAPILANSYQIVCPDLRGYGRSDKPVSNSLHSPYSKRAMAKDIVAVMKNLGHDKFLVGAHDRGARVAHRLGLDHPDCVKAMVLLDIGPTREMYAGTSTEFARAYWHWFFLIQPQPLPEQIISADPEGFWKLKCFNQTNGEFDVFMAGVGTGGTISGCGKYLKSVMPKVQIVGVDCVGSIVAHFAKTGEMGEAHTYVLEGLGEDFIPGNYDFEVIDDWEVVGDKESFIMTRKLQLHSNSLEQTTSFMTK